MGGWARCWLIYSAAGWPDAPSAGGSVVVLARPDRKRKKREALESCIMGWGQPEARV